MQGVTTPVPAPAGHAPPDPTPERMPTAAWALAWSSVLAQVMTALDVGVKPLDDEMVLLSMLLGALVVWWFAAGVLAARTVRLVVTALLLGLMLLVEVVTVVAEALDGRVGITVLHLVTSVLMIGSLWWFTRTPYFACQRTRPARPGPSRAGVLTVAVLVGLSAGVVQPAQDGLRVELNASR